MNGVSSAEEDGSTLSIPRDGSPLDVRPVGTAAINARIADGTAVVFTLEQLCHAARNMSLPTRADLVTVAFAAEMSGSAAMLVVPVAGRGVFTRAEEIFLNRLRGYPGPAPNERLGVVDTMIFADEQSPDASLKYDGASLFLDLLRGERVEVDCHSVEGTRHANSFVLRDAEFARFYVYNASLPAGAAYMKALREALVPGSRIALNGAEGIVVGPGTRNRPDRMTVSITADMYEMDARLMSQAGARPQHVIAFALLANDERSLSELVDWASTQAGESLLSPAAQTAAERLQKSIQEGHFQLSETGPATR